MFGYVIQIRDSLLVLGIFCIIMYSLILSRALATPADTNTRRGYDMIVQFSHYMLLLPGILFFALYLFFVLRVRYSAGKITGASKRIRKQRATQDL